MEPGNHPDRRIPVRIDKRTVILVKEGADIKKRVEKYKNHKPWAR